MLLPTDDNIKTVTDLREQTIPILNSLAKKDGPTLIFHRSSPKAVLLSMAVYQKMADMLEDYQDSLEASEIIGQAKAKREKLYSLSAIDK